MTWYQITDATGWTSTTNSRETAMDWWKRWGTKGPRRIVEVRVDGVVVWPRQTKMEFNR